MQDLNLKDCRGPRRGLRPTADAAAGAALLAGWLAAGSTGLLAHSLRHVLTLMACGAVCVLERPRLGGSPARWAVLLGGMAALTVTTASSQVPVNVAGVAAWLGTLALLHEGLRQQVSMLVAVAVMGLAVFRVACSGIPLVWTAADWVGGAMGRVGGAIAGRPLSVGVTFGGVDFLATMAVFWVAWTASLPSPRWRRGAMAAGAIVVGHVLFLVVLAFAADMRNGLPEARPASQRSGTADLEKPSGRGRWIEVARLGLPWNLPMVGAVIQMVIAGGVVGRMTSQEERAEGLSVQAALTPCAGARQDPSTASRATAQPGPCAVSRLPSATGNRLGERDGGEAERPAEAWATIGRWVWTATSGTMVLAVLLPAATWLWPARLTLEGKKIVVNERGYLNWLKPEHGQYGSRSGGMYGLLEDHLALYGAQTRISSDLSEKDLSDADVLMLIFPNERWQPGQLDRIWRFVEKGGSLLVLGEHTTKDEDGSNRFNEVLKPTAMRVAFDSATFAVGGWLHSYAPQAHPSTAGITDDANSFGVVIGASVDTRWPAHPILCGKWGWNDPGDEGERGTRAMLGNNRYDAGERLGDLVLAAEECWGKGRVIVLGDTSGFTNGIASSCHEFWSRLFGYLAARDGAAHPLGRQVLGLGLALVLVAWLTWMRHPLPPTLAGVGLALSLSVCHERTMQAGRLIPDGARQTPNNLAYIDSTHLGLYSDEGWRDDAVGGLRLTLNRSGYAAFSLTEYTRDRLLRAGLLISIAPAKAFSAEERRIAREFVEQGGILIVTVGYEERRASADLLADFGFEVGRVLSANRAALPPPPSPSSELRTPISDLRPPPPDSAAEVHRVEERGLGANRPLTAEPQPLGHFKVPYVDAGEYKAYVRYWAAWPVACTATNARVIAYGHGDVPVIVQRTVGRGKVVVIGDTGFAMNKNLEREDGQPIEGMRENAHFWRWFLTALRDQPMWIPPKGAGR